MNQKFIYYIIFVLTFLLFNFVQEHARPNYSGDNQLIIYCLGVLPNFLPGIGLPSLLYVLIPEVFQPGTPLFNKRLKWSLSISMAGLIGAEMDVKYYEILMNNDLNPRHMHLLEIFHYYIHFLIYFVHD